MRPPSLRRLSREDFADRRDAQDRLLSLLNGFFEEVAVGLNRRLTFGENFAAEVLQVEVTAPDEWAPISSWGAGWSASSDASFPSPAVRWEGGRVHSRGLVVHSGVPAAATTLATLPSGYGCPGSGMREMLHPHPTSGIGEVRVYSSGVLEYHAGGAALSLSGLSWEASGAPPPWAAPVRKALRADFPGKPTGLLVLAAREASEGLPVAGCHVDWTPDTTPEGRPGIRIRRVSGLSPGRRYLLTLLAVAG